MNFVNRYSKAYYVTILKFQKCGNRLESLFRLSDRLQTRTYYDLIMHKHNSEFSLCWQDYNSV